MSTVNAKSLTAKLRAIADALAPEGYEDARGFHFGHAERIDEDLSFIDKALMAPFEPECVGHHLEFQEDGCVRVLHLEDSSSDAALILDWLERGGLKCSLTHARNKSEFEWALDHEQFDVILCDHNLPGYSGFAALEFSRARQPHTPFIILSGALDDEQAVECLHNGAADYILKDRMARLIPAIRRAMTEAAERKQQAAAQKRIQEQAELLNLTRDAIVVRDMDDRITFWNAGAESIFGWKASEAQGRHFASLLHGAPPLFADARQSLMETSDWVGELQLASRKGQEVVVMSHWNLIKDPSGKPTAIVCTNTDITEQKKLEKVVLRAQRMESIGSLASGVAHDLNNALSPVLLSASLMENCQDPEQRRRYVDVIVSCVQRGARMLKQILNFTDGRQGRLGLVSVCAQVRELEKMIRDTFPKSIEIKVQVAAHPCTILGDPTELHQALLNLCVNARDAMPDGGRLTMSVQRADLDEVTAGRLDGKPGPHVMLSVTDTGWGIPEEVLPRIFEPFFTTKGPDQGTGLGLSIVAGIMKNCGGCLDVKTEPDSGTEFRLYFPAVETAEFLEATGDEGPVPAGHGELVLLMEDEEAIRELTRTSLENFGYRVVTAPNGVQGIARFEEYRDRIRVVVSDTDMPKMNGLAAVRAIKEMRPELPVIVASGSQHSSQEIKQMSDHRMTRLRKPYSLQELLVTVSSAVRD